MKQVFKWFNLSKFYTLNWLLWTSLIGNIIVFFANLRKLKILTNNFTVYKGYGWIIFYTEVTYSFLLILFFTIFFIGIIEFILRKINKISAYNTIKMLKPFRIILSFLAFSFIIGDIYIFYTAFSIIEKLFY